MKTIIAGSRDIKDPSVVESAIRGSGFTITEVVSGCAPGVDLLGSQWAAANNIPWKAFPADWNKHGRQAGPIRNAKMADYAEALICIHHNTPGSLNMLKVARSLGLEVYEVNFKEPEAVRLEKIIWNAKPESPTP